MRHSTQRPHCDPTRGPRDPPRAPEASETPDKVNTPEGEAAEIFAGLHTLRGRRGRQYQWQQRTPERTGCRGREQLEKGQRAPTIPHRIMREPRQPQQVNTDIGPGQTTGTYLPLGRAPINLETTIPSQHPITTTIDPSLPITPPDYSDVRKQKTYFSKSTLSI